MRQKERGRGLAKVGRGPHLACASGPATWGAGLVARLDTPLVAPGPAGADERLEESTMHNPQCTMPLQMTKMLSKSWSRS